MDTTSLDSGSGETAAKAAWCLAIVGHRDPLLVGSRTPLSPTEPLTLGREQSAFGEGAFNDDRISRHHARVEVTDDKLQISDLSSRNGTYVNETKVNTARLRHGDVVRLGTVVLVALREPALFERIADPDLVGISYEHSVMIGRLIELAPRDNTVIIVGETGSGKRLVAEALHRHSGRDGAIVTIYCGSMADSSMANELFGHLAGAFAGASSDRVGLIESAANGTLLLDGIDDASAELQALLLEFLDSGTVRRIGAPSATRVNARVVAASRRPLAEAVDDGSLRRDFVERLGKLTLRVPPLRHRRLDVGPLAQLFVERFTGKATPLHHRLSAALAMHAWPGNIRELEGVIELAAIDGAGDDILRLTPDLGRLLSVAALDGEKPNLEPTPAGVLTIAGDGSWFEPPGKKPVDLSQRPTVARLLAALAHGHRDDSERAFSVTDLLAIGWPDERVIERAGANRVYVALTTLRKLGLRDWITRTRQGYQIPCEIRVVIR